MEENRSESRLHPALLLAERVNSAINDRLDVRRNETIDRPLTADAVSALLRIAYDASLLEEEGRRPTIRLVHTSVQPHLRVGTNSSSDSPCINSAEELLKLSPIANHPDSALAIKFDELNKVKCIGIYKFRDLIFSLSRRSHDDSWVGEGPLRDTVFFIRIEAAGHIRAGLLPGPTFILRNGFVTERRAWDSVDVTQAVFSEFGSILDRKIRNLARSGRKNRNAAESGPGIEALLDPPRQTTRLLIGLWANVLRLTAAKRHGGTFIFDLKSRRKPIEKVKASGIVRSKIASFNLIEHCLDTIQDAWRLAGEDITKFSSQWGFRRDRLYESVELLVGLASVDGSIIIDKNFNAIAFGCILKIDDRIISKSRFEDKGTRHKSAEQYCKKNKALAFVISQDGELSIIDGYSDAQELRSMRDIVPDVTFSEK